MDAQSIETHVREGRTTEQQTVPESEADKPHQCSSYSCYTSVRGWQDFCPLCSQSALADKCKKLDYLVKTSHEPSPTARRAGSNNPKETGYMCALEVANKTFQYMI